MPHIDTTIPHADTKPHSDTPHSDTPHADAKTHSDIAQRHEDVTTPHVDIIQKHTDTHGPTGSHVDILPR
jgi:hypothetical protein